MKLPLAGTLALLGAGKMGGALLEGWLRQGLDPAQIVAFDPHPPPEVAAVLGDRMIRHTIPIRRRSKRRRWCWWRSSRNSWTKRSARRNR